MISKKLKAIIGILVIDTVVALFFGLTFTKAIAYVIITSILVAFWTEFVFTKKVRLTKW